MVIGNKKFNRRDFGGFAENRRGKFMIENEITEIIIGCAIKVHKALGPGLLESAYEECLFYELNKTDLKTEKQKALPLIYDDIKLECGYRMDLVVENSRYIT